jgi:hypothetical protein
MEGNPELSENKRKRRLSLEDIYRLLEQVYIKVSESRYRSNTLSKILSKHRSRGGGVRLKQNPSYEKQQRYVRQLPETKYNPKLERPSFSGGKVWSEPAHYNPKERLVYDPEVKALLQRIEKNLREAVNSETKDEGEKFERSSEILENNETKESEVSLEKVLERAGEDGMGLVGPLEMGEEEFNWLVEELKRRGGLTGEELESGQEASEVKLEEGNTEIQSDIEVSQENENPEPTEEYERYLVFEADAMSDWLHEIESGDVEANLDQMEAEPIQEEIPNMELELPELFEEELDLEQVEPEEY